MDCLQKLNDPATVPAPVIDNVLFLAAGSIDVCSCSSACSRGRCGVSRSSAAAQQPAEKRTRWEGQAAPALRDPSSAGLLCGTGAGANHASHWALGMEPCWGQMGQALAYVLEPKGQHSVASIPRGCNRIAAGGCETSRLTSANIKWPLASHLQMSPCPLHLHTYVRVLWKALVTLQSVFLYMHAAHSAQCTA